MTTAAATTWIDLLRPTDRTRTWTYDVLVVLGGSLLIALSARVALLLPGSPVPVTGQTFAVLFLGALFGSRRGALAVVAYLTEGALGLPFFTGGAGVLYLVGPTGGYLAGFVAAAWTVGRLAERGWDRRPVSALAAMLAGNGVIYLCGAAWLAVYVGPGRAATLGVLPYVPGDLIKIALAAFLLPLGWRLFGRRRDA